MILVVVFMACATFTSPNSELLQAARKIAFTNGFRTHYVEQQLLGCQINSSECFQSGFVSGKILQSGLHLHQINFSQSFF